MPEIPIVTVRKSGYSDYEIHTLRNHGWFMFEGVGTICFKPDMMLSEKRAKLILGEYIESKRNLPARSGFFS